MFEQSMAGLGFFARQLMELVLRVVSPTSDPTKLEGPANERPIANSLVRICSDLEILSFLASSS
jgi:hypothetical protein